MGLSMELLYRVCYGFTTLLGIAQGFFVLYKNPRSRINVTWSLMCFMVAAWAAGSGLYFFEPVDDQKALFLCRTALYAASFIPVFFTHFCLALLNKPLRESRVGVAGYLFTIALGGFFLTPWFVPSVPPKVIFRHYVEPGPLFVAFTIQFFAMVFYSHWLLFKHLHRQSTERQNQIKYVALGTVVGYACGSTTFLLAYNIPFNPLPSLFTPVYFAFITYAIVKHRLMDIDVVIRKSLVYSVLVATITAVYFCVVLLAEKWFQGMLGYRSLLISVVAGFAIALGFTPLKEVVQRIVDQFFFRGGVGALAQENERLRQEVTRAERLKAVGTLAAGMAHEIKNPLTAIKTFTEFLPDRYDDVEFRQKFQRIVGGEVNRINHLVQRLLEFARPSIPQLAPVQVSEVIRETLECLQAIAVQKRIRVETSFDEPGHIQADREQLKQALLNILLNGIEAMDPGGRLDVTTRQRQGFVEVCIEDTGAGIPQEVLPRVFDPFYTTKERGTGLGLSIVHTIVTEHGGRIALESHPGHGTRVTLKFPLASSADTEALAQPANTATNGTG